jgi:hypothetical protein
MTRLVGWLSLATIALTIPAVSEGFGRRGGCREECAPACYTPCAPYMPPAAPEIRYEERTVTYQKPVWKDRVIEETVVRCVPRTEKFVYDVRVPQHSEEKRTIKVSRPVMKEEKFTQRVAYMVRDVEKRTVTVNVPTYSDVEYTYDVRVAKHRPVTRTVPTCTYETRHIETTVPVCRVVRDVVTDECGRCHTVCRTVVDHQKVVRCVRVPVHGTREVVVNECYYETETRKGVRRVCNWEKKETVVEVPVCRTEYKDVERSRMVCHHEVVDQVVTVPVCNWVTEKREGTRQVMDRVADKVSRTVKVCEYETVTETIRVAVGGDCHAVSYGCHDDCGGGRRGLFRRR